MSSRLARLPSMKQKEPKLPVTQTVAVRRENLNPFSLTLSLSRWERGFLRTRSWALKAVPCSSAG